MAVVFREERVDKKLQVRENGRQDKLIWCTFLLSRLIFSLTEHPADNQINQQIIRSED